MRICSLVLCIAYALLGLTSQEVLASPKEKKLIHIAFVDNKLPYSSRQHSGFEIEIVRAALAQVGLTLEAHFFDNDKLNLALSSGRVDAVAPSFNHSGQFYESDDFISYYNYAITKQSRGIILKTITDISEYNSAAWKNAHIHLGDKFNKTFSPILKQQNASYTEISNQINQCRMFWLDRIDIIIIDKTIFAWCKLQLTDLDTSEEVAIHSLFNNPNNYPVLFRSKYLRDQFNIGLQTIKNSGQYQLIIERQLEAGMK